MTGFFDRMAQRADGSENRWQIRPRARFESPAASVRAGRADGLLHDGSPGDEVGPGLADGPEVMADETGRARPDRAGVRGVRRNGPDRAPADGHGGVRDWWSDAADADRADGALRSRAGAEARSAARDEGLRTDRTWAGEVHDPVSSQASHGAADASDELGWPAHRPGGSGDEEAAGRPGHSWRSGTRDGDDGPDLAGPGTGTRTPRPAVALPDTATLLRDHVVPALRAEGLLGPDEAIDIRGPGERRPVRPATSTLVPGTVRVPPGPGTGPPGQGATTRPAGTGHLDHGRRDRIDGHDTPAPTPEIHVHIDRIDLVRATPAPSPPVEHRPTATSPAPDRLGDFLEQRRADR